MGVLLTQTPGASDYYLGGVVAYHNRIKRSMLGVYASTLRKHGAVSAQTAQEMAQGAQKKFGADLGVAITGIAGPGGGTKEKPVGLVYVALAEGRRVQFKRFLFSGGRAKIRAQAAKKALALIRRKKI